MRLRSALAAVLLLAPAVASAHTGVDHAEGFAHGFAHPFSGLDHLLAMFAVGLFAFRLGGRALWAVPAAFMGMMALGGVAGFEGAALPYVETAIALSVVALGLVVATGVALPTAVATAFVGIFAIFHGHAHGGELPAGTAAAAYTTGFLAATGLLHAAGIAAAALLSGRLAVVRLGGAAVALAGVALLAGV